MSTQCAPKLAAVAIPTGHLLHSAASEHAAQTLLLSQARRLRLGRQVGAEAHAWTASARATGTLSLCEAILEAFGLGTPEGKAFMRLAEALLRTRDRATAWKLLCENLRSAHWEAPLTAHRGARALAAVLQWMSRAVLSHEARLAPLSTLFVAAARFGVALAAKQFIVADNISQALRRMRRDPALRLCSIDCLGESARTEAQAQRYFRAYEHVIEVLAREPAAPLHLRHGISIKLSALEPRFGPRYRGTYHARLIPQVLHLAQRAAAAGIGLTIDAEEQDRLESTLDVMAALIDDPTTRSWAGLGLAVQAYGLRAPHVITWLADRARARERRMTVRLVKGAYWDSEIKRAQERGLDAFPVFTEKCATDVSYLVCAHRLFEQQNVIFPQFATHNAMTVAAVRAIAPPGAAYEFQRLHGMGEQLYRTASQSAGFPPVRAYAPVGSREDLLAYLIRRLLENGANSSFVRHFLDPSMPIATLLENPIDVLSERLQRRDANRCHIAHS